MHFSIPDTQECSDESGAYTVFNIHVNGVAHCSVRYSQLHHFNEQMKKEFGQANLPPFPPKKLSLFTLTPQQIEERREQLERYIQIVSQDPVIVGSDIFNSFLNQAQQETQKAEPEAVELDVFLMNGHKISVSISSTDQTDDVLETVASQIELSDDFVYYFALFLVKKEKDGGNSIVRKLQEFESPYISLKTAESEAKHRIVLRKNFWEPSMDNDLLDDRIAMNLLYVQAVNDIERGWVFASKEVHKQLAALQTKGSKKEYLKLARTLKSYGFIQFKPCVTDFPQPNCPVIVSAGNRELNFRIKVANNQVKEGIFKVTRMRCWRITTQIPETNGANAHGDSKDLKPKLEVAFEYLVAKDKLQWITIESDQAILISMCLQGMVDELIMKKQGGRIKRPQDRVKRSQSRQFLRKDGKTALPKSISAPGQLGTPDTNGDENVSAAQRAKDSVRRISDKFSSVTLKSTGRSTRGPAALVENDVFEDSYIGDDDL
ncbi:PREDICTED: sorting nexin-17-like [Branchiostoma belcheri]|uniref:Sorting nexin-17 n=1 Tax=Branchiostoma belcheri TaxID=7741 RepID=A0A6P4ZFM5_BRABE|nr:PREDICTED: sorting nexin-17-like [Branchiostoma belcheri]KAI8497403.1 Sorting nexin-17 [Branchiostoma belcheri]